MSNPYGGYAFAALGFTDLNLDPGGAGYLTSAQGTIFTTFATYTDATGVVTFSVGESPAGVTDLNFTGNIILDLSGNVAAIAGTWTGRNPLIVSTKPAAPAASAHAESAAHGIVPPSILEAHGSWAAFNHVTLLQRPPSL